MTRSEILQWIQTEFSPLKLTTPQATLEQKLEEAIRYWNTHSAYKVAAMVSGGMSTHVVTLPLGLKNVAEVYPNAQQSFVFQGNPLFSLLGVPLLDNITSDLINVTESFKSYVYYLGMNFTWQFLDSGDPSVPSRLLVQNIPAGASQLAVMGCYRILPGVAINQEHILEWILCYFRALVKIQYGRLLRVTNVINVKNDGGDLVSEGTNEKKELEERLGREGRWFSFSKRI